MEDYQISRAEGPIASFQKHFASLASSQEFSDVTLVCKDLKPVALHRVILSSSSPWFRDLLPKLPDKPTIYLDNIDPLALAPLLAFIYKGEAKVAKTLLSSFMEAANILMIDGLNDKDKVENKLGEKREAGTQPPYEQSEIMEHINLLETKLEGDYLFNIDGMSCDLCDFKTAAKSKYNQTSVMKRHKKAAHDGDKDGEIVAEERPEILESSIGREPNDANLSCSICGFTTSAKSKGNQVSVMSRHNRKVHGNGEQTIIHLSENSEEYPSEDQTITLGEDLAELNHEEATASSNEDGCQTCGFHSSAKSKGNRSMALKRHLMMAHQPKSGEIIFS